MSETAEVTPPSSATVPHTLALVAWFVALALFAPVIGWLVHIWSTSIYDAHGVLVPFIAAIMVLSRRNALTAAPRAPAGAGLGLVLLGVLLLLAALLMDFNLLGGVALVITLAGLVWSLWGGAALKTLAFPLDFLAGAQTRAPRFVQQIGFEWLWRMFTNPKRLFRRYAKNLFFSPASARACSGCARGFQGLERKPNSFSKAWKSWATTC